MSRPSASETRPTSPRAAQLPWRVVALYQFSTFADCEAIRQLLAQICAANGIKGTLLLAREGINGTIAGSDHGIDQVIAHIRSLPGCAAIEVKQSRAATLPFHRMKVRIKREIVTMGQPDLDPGRGAGKYIAPADWNALIDRPDTILIDTRNDYEVAIGSFTGALDPGTTTFRDFPAWFSANRDSLLARSPAPKIAMFCTGGIRCEKATAYLKSEGLEDVFHLKGGILAYLEQMPPEQSRWQGECFVFDERVSVTHGLGAGTHELCRACRVPLSPDQRASELYVPGVSCPACHEDRTGAQRERYAERQRQTELAELRGTAHIGASPSAK
ncbi:MAG TPA: rhodanese-related sulfurtransferase [Novosphingobium sp.]|nr:rhodanese-related sulfurtransferase [Novosphingobium sp.]